MRIKKLLGSVLRSPWLSIVNVLLCAGAVFANTQLQVFCRPVPWAVAVLVIAFLPVMLYPVLRQRLDAFHGVVFFLFGLAACISVYCILFLAEMNFWGAFGLPTLFYQLFSHRIDDPLPSGALMLLTYVPHFFLLQIIGFAFFSKGHRPRRKYFAAGVGLCAAYALTMALWFNAEYGTIRAAWSGAPAADVPRNYMTELMLGMHFKYHLSFCGYDGWRPPLHDPSIVVAVWLTAPFRSSMDIRGFGKSPYPRDPAHISRIDVYKAVFPEKPVRQPCSCAAQYREWYMKDPALN